MVKMASWIFCSQEGAIAAFAPRWIRCCPKKCFSGFSKFCIRKVLHGPIYFKWGYVTCRSECVNLTSWLLTKTVHANFNINMENVYCEGVPWNSNLSVFRGAGLIGLTRGVQYIWNTKLHQMVMDEFIMLEKHAHYPLFIPMGLLGLETWGSML